MNAAERSDIVTRLATYLAAHYVSADIGARYAAMLKARLAGGAYDRATDAAVFAATLTSDLQAVASDRHLRIGLKATFDQPRQLPGDAPLSTRASGPPGLEEAKMIGTVAYLRFNAFPDEPQSAERSRAFLLAHADATAVIIDCRPNRGGGLSVMNAILPLLYHRRSVQVRMDTRVVANPLAQGEDDPTLIRQRAPDGIERYDHVIEPDPHEQRLQHVPLFYLTSRRTASAAEHFALGLKRNHRALLIGETTAGANHFGDEVSVGSRFLAFIPEGRSFDPATGLDWEGTGILPDLRVPADEALSVALAEAATATARPASRRRSSRS